MARIARYATDIVLCSEWGGIRGLTECRTNGVTGYRRREALKRPKPRVSPRALGKCLEKAVSAEGAQEPESTGVSQPALRVSSRRFAPPKNWY
jgi:hypothetical protein